MKAEWRARACPLCGSPEGGRVFAESNINVEAFDGFAFASRKLPEYMHPRLVECGRCGILYANPALSADTLAGAYWEADFDSAREAHYASITYAAQVRRILHRLPDLQGALDIGTGDGAFLEQLLHLGFQNVNGMEASEAPVAAAKPHIKPLIRQGLFRPEDFPPASLALDSCFQTLEHVSCPFETTQAARQLLKPGGAFIAVVHNLKAVTTRLLGMKSPIFDIEHLQLFCPATSRQLLVRAGFREVSVRSLWNRYPLYYWTKLLPIPNRIKRPLLSVLKRSALGAVPISLPPGNLVCCGFK